MENSTRKWSSCRGKVREKKDYIASFRYFEKAAKLGDLVAQENLSIFYFYAIGVLQNHEQAYAWSSVALATGVNDAKIKSYLANIQRYSQYNLMLAGKNGAYLKKAKQSANE